MCSGDAYTGGPPPPREGGERAKARPREKSRDIARLEEELSDTLATPVSIKLGARNRGQLVIDFANLDALDELIAKLRA